MPYVSRPEFSVQPSLGLMSKSRLVALKESSSRFTSTLAAVDGSTSATPHPESAAHVTPAAASKDFVIIFFPTFRRATERRNPRERAGQCHIDTDIAIDISTLHATTY